MKFSFGQPQKGDIVRIALKNGIYHYGIYVDDTEVVQFGLPPVGGLSGGADIRVVATDIYAFLCGRFLEVACLTRAQKKRAYAPEEVVCRARAMLGTGGYNALENNCEHFVNYCVFGAKQSAQADGAKAALSGAKKVFVYIAKLPSEYVQAPLYPKERAEYVSSFKHDNAKIQRQCVWQLLAFALKNTYNIDIEHTDICKVGDKWSLSGYGISLSHTSHYAAVAISRLPVGVDIEDMTSGDKTRQFEKIACEQERAEYGPTVSAPELLKLWTKKESIFKRGDVRAFIPSQINTLEHTAHTFILKKFNLVLSVAADGDADITAYGAALGGRYKASKIKL